MPNIVAAVTDHDDEISDLVGYHFISGHLIYNVKLCEIFRRKDRFVVDGHLMDTPSSIIYNTVVSRYLVIICLTIADFNDLDVLASVKENAYLTAPFLEKVWIRSRTEFGNP